MTGPGSIGRDPGGGPLRRRPRKGLPSLAPFPVLILLWIFVAFGFVPAAASTGTDSPPPKGILSVSLDREAVALGGAITLTLNYRLPEGGRLEEPPEVLGLEGRGAVTVANIVSDLGVHAVLHSVLETGLSGLALSEARGAG